MKEITTQQILDQSREEKKEKFLIACDIKGKIGAIMLEDLLAFTLRAFVEAEIAKEEGEKKSDKGKIKITFADGTFTEQDAESNMVIGYNQSKEETISHLKELLVTLNH